MSNAVTVERVYNFSAGPAVLPEPVLEQVRDEMLCLPGVGSSVLEISHRSPAFEEILDNTTQGIRNLFQVNDDYEILFLQGGSRLQFAMVPMNLIPAGESADYLVTGSWSQKAAQEAVGLTDSKIVWDGKPDRYRSVPQTGDYETNTAARYLYYCSNETIQGVQFQDHPEGKNLVCDASSDFLSRPMDISKHAVVYACAQKNAGPAGVNVVILRRDLLDAIPDGLPGYLDYRSHVDAGSRYNTPPTFAIYVTGLVLNWVEQQFGSLESIQKHNEQKCALLYDVIDRYSDFYIGHAVERDRSKMNVTFKFDNEKFDALFKTMAAERQLTNLGGHRSVGGIRASIYNAMPVAGVQTLADFMEEFAQQNG